IHGPARPLPPLAPIADPHILDARKTAQNFAFWPRRLFISTGSAKALRTTLHLFSPAIRTRAYGAHATLSPPFTLISDLAISASFLGGIFASEEPTHGGALTY